MPESAGASGERRDAAATLEKHEAHSTCLRITRVINSDFAKNIHAFRAFLAWTIGARDAHRRAPFARRWRSDACWRYSARAAWTAWGAASATRTSGGLTGWTSRRFTKMCLRAR